MAWPVQQLLLLMVLVYNIGIPAGNCVGGTDNVAIGDEEGIGGVDEGGRYGGGPFPPNPGQRQQDLALTK